MPQSLDATILRNLFAAPHDYLTASQLTAPLSPPSSVLHEQLIGLEKAGYRIEHHASLGYRLGTPPELLCADEIIGRLNGRLPWRMIVLRETRSTMDVVLREGRVRAPEGLVVLAERQVAGRGRQGRAWESSPQCGLYLSLLLRPKWPLEEFPRLTLLISLAATEALERVTSLPVRIKWPNDLMIQRKKVGGILTEVQLDSAQDHFAVVGLGLNINQTTNDFSPELQPKATSLRLESETSWRRAEILLALLNAIETRYSDSFDTIREAWIQRCITLGEYITVQTPTGPRQGHALGIQDNGSLLLRTEGGTTEVITSGLVES